MKCIYIGKYYLGDKVLYKTESGGKIRGQIYKVDINATSGECLYHISNRYHKTIISDADIIKLIEAGAERIINNI